MKRSRFAARLDRTFAADRFKIASSAPLLVAIPFFPATGRDAGSAAFTRMSRLSLCLPMPIPYDQTLIVSGTSRAGQARVRTENPRLATSG